MGVSRWHSHQKGSPMALLVSAASPFDDSEDLGTGEGGGGREAAPPPGPGDLGSMGGSVTPHALNSEGNLDIADFRFLAAGIDTLDLGFYVKWPSDSLHQELEKLREDAAG